MPRSTKKEPEIIQVLRKKTQITCGDRLLQVLHMLLFIYRTPRLTETQYFGSKV